MEWFILYYIVEDLEITTSNMRYNAAFAKHICTWK